MNLDLLTNPARTVLRCASAYRSCRVLAGLDGGPQRENAEPPRGLKRLKIPVSVVRFRPWAPTMQRNQGHREGARIALVSTTVLRACFLKARSARSPRIVARNLSQ